MIRLPIRYKYVPILIALIFTGAVQAKEPASGLLQLNGEIVQGGIVIGQALPGARVTFDKRTIRVTEQGEFVIGFNRNEKGPVSLVVTHADGSTAARSLDITQREYQIQRIDGLPPKKVTPDAKALKQIRKENAQIGAARRRNDARNDFAVPFIWPTHGPISGVYGSQRILNGQPRRPHFGVDIARPTGTPVKAPAPGIISYSNPDMYFSGGTLVLDHGHGLSSSFLHLSKLHVKTGQRVEQGELIAEIGATGRVTGPHLDWRMNLFKRRVDPTTLVGPMPD